MTNYNLKAVNLLLMVPLVLYRAPVIKNVPYGRRCCVSPLLGWIILSEVIDFFITLGVALHLSSIRSQMSDDELKRPSQEKTPSSILVYSQLAFMVIISVSLGILRYILFLHDIWTGNPRGEYGIAVLIPWLQFQVQYFLVLTFLYRIRTMSFDTRGNWAEQFKSEVQQYIVYFYAVIPIYICQLAITTILQNERGGQNIIFLFYALVAEVIVYGISLAFLELALIFTDLTACGFSREAIMDSILTFQLKDMFTITEPEKP